LIGGIFIVSGFEKLVHPYENFLYVIQSYDVLDKNIDELTAAFFPWIEFIAGSFVLFGLWLSVSLRVVWCLTVIFLIVVSQAVFRNLPIHECGCFGELLSIPIPVILIFDSSLIVIMTLLRRMIECTRFFSLDRYFQK